ncbi:MAG: sulfatase [bacterium]
MSDLQPTRAQTASAPRGVVGAIREALLCAVPTAGVLALLEAVDAVLSNPGYTISGSSRVFFLLAILSFFVTAAVLIALVQGPLLAGARRLLFGRGAWIEAKILPKALGRLTAAPRWWSSILAGGVCLLPLGFYFGYRLFHFTIDAQFELPREAAAVMSMFHLAGLGGIAVVSLIGGWLLGRATLKLLPPNLAIRALATLLLLIAATLGYLLYTRVFTRILDLRWLGWVSFGCVFLCLQGTLLLLLHRGEGGVARDPDTLRGKLHRVLAHRITQLAALCLAAVVLSAGFHGYSGLQVVRFQVHRFARFTPHVAAALLSVLDRDGDGHAAVLGGLDCDDSDPQRYPDAHDVPSDGKDSNCVAGDVKRPEILKAWLDQRTAGRIRQAGALPVPRKKYNILLITIDACRPDHMSVYGYKRRTTPNLEVLARNALVFTRAHSQGNFTDLSLYSLLTGLYPSAFIKGRSIVPGRSLATYLRGFGYETHAINDLREGRGYFAQGFDRFDNTLALRNRGAVQNQTSLSTGADITTLAKNFLDGRRDKPFLLWVHYGDPHGRYLKHPGLDFGSSDRDRYDSELAYTDRQIAALLGHARARGLLKSSVIAVASDHGEAFGEHGTRTHGHSLYEEETRVPLMIFVPTGRGGGHGRRVDTPVENVDLVPTLLDLIGFDQRVPPMHGETLLDLGFANRPLRSPEVFAEHRNRGANTKALTVGSWKIIYDVRHSFFELYDLARDPREKHNLADDRPRQLDKLKKRLFRWMDLWLNGFKTFPVK